MGTCPTIIYQWPYIFTTFPATINRYTCCVMIWWPIDLTRRQRQQQHHQLSSPLQVLRLVCVYLYFYTPPYSPPTGQAIRMVTMMMTTTDAFNLIHIDISTCPLSNRSIKRVYVCWEESSHNYVDMSNSIIMLPCFSKIINILKWKTSNRNLDDLYKQQVCVW